MADAPHPLAPPPPVDSNKIAALIDDLRRVEGIPVGVGEEIAIATLLTRLFGEGVIAKPTDLKPYLGPLIARSESDLEKFSRAFDRWFPPERPPPVRETGSDSAAAAPKLSPLQRLREFRIGPVRAWIVAIVAIGAAIVLAFLWPHPKPVPQQQNFDSYTPSFERPTALAAPAAESESDVVAAVNSVYDGAGQDCAWIAPPYANVSRHGELSLVELGQAFSNYGPTGSCSIDVPNGKAFGSLAGLPPYTPLKLQSDPTTLGKVAYAEEIWRHAADVPPVSHFIRQAEAVINGRGARANAVDGIANASARPDPTAFDLLSASDQDRDTLQRGAALWIASHINGRSAETPPQLDDPNKIGDEPAWRGSTWTADDNYGWAAWRRWVWPLAPLLLLFIWLAGSMDRRRAFLSRRLPSYPPAVHELVAVASRTLPFAGTVVRRAAQRLQQWAVRTTDRLDAQRTAERSAAEGRFTPVYARQRAIAEYLVLIEAVTGGDQETQRLRALVRRLEDRHLIVHVYYFEGDPVWCRKEVGRTRDGASPLAGPALAIDDVVRRHGDCRLLVLGAGEGFIDPSRETVNPGAQALREFQERAMLTPTPIKAWGSREFIIAQALGLPIGRATPEGARNLATLLGLEGAELRSALLADGDGLAPQPPLYLSTERRRWTLDSVVSDTTWSKLENDLRAYLDSVTFQWLCACAIYPELRFDLTLFLGSRLKDRQGEPVYREDRVARLLQLPWFRLGRMPDWLRTRLIETMDGEQKRLARVALRSLVDTSVENVLGPDDAALRLRIATIEPGKERPLEDMVFLDFMARGDVTDLEVGWLDPLRRRAPDLAKPAFDKIGLLLCAFGVLWAVVAFITAPYFGRLGVFDWIHPRIDAPAPNTAPYEPLIALWIVGALLTLFVTDMTSVTTRKWHTVATLAAILIASTAVGIGGYFCLDGPLYQFFSESFSYTKIEQWVSSEYASLAAFFIVAGIASAFALPVLWLTDRLLARFGATPQLKTIKWPRRLGAMVVRLPLVLAGAFGLVLVLANLGRAISPSYEHFKENHWVWGGVGPWMVALVYFPVIGVGVSWLLLGLARRWRRLAQHPVKIDRRGHTLGTLAVCAGAGLIIATAGYGITRYDTWAGQQDTVGAGAIRTFTYPVQGRINSVAFSPDGTRILTGADDNVARLWDVASGRQLAGFNGVSTMAQTGVGVSSVAFSPDGSRVAISSPDRTVRFFDATSGRATQVLNLNPNVATSAPNLGAPTFRNGLGAIAFSPDGRRVVATGDDSPVELWDAAAGRLLQTFADADGTQITGFDAVAFSPNGRQVAAASSTASALYLWDSATGRLLHTIMGQETNVISVAFSSDGTRLLTGGSNDATVRLWDVASGRALQQFVGQISVNAVAFAPDGQTIITADSSGSMQIWNVSTGAVVKTVNAHGDAINSIAYSPDGSHVLTGSNDGTARLWDTATMGQLPGGASVWISAIRPWLLWFSVLGVFGAAFLSDRLLSPLFGADPAGAPLEIRLLLALVRGAISAAFAVGFFVAGYSITNSTESLILLLAVAAAGALATAALLGIAVLQRRLFKARTRRKRLQRPYGPLWLKIGFGVIALCGAVVGWWWQVRSTTSLDDYFAPDTRTTAYSTWNGAYAADATRDGQVWVWDNNAKRFARTISFASAVSPGDAIVHAAVDNSGGVNCAVAATANGDVILRGPSGALTRVSSGAAVAPRVLVVADFVLVADEGSAGAKTIGGAAAASRTSTVTAYRCPTASVAWTTEGPLVTALGVNASGEVLVGETNGGYATISDVAQNPGPLPANQDTTNPVPVVAFDQTGAPVLPLTLSQPADAAAPTAMEPATATDAAPEPNTTTLAPNQSSDPEVQHSPPSPSSVPANN